MTADRLDIGHRKTDHLDLCATGDVSFRGRTTLLEDVSFVHDALPELSLDELDTSVVVFGKRLRLPIMMAGMTGGNARAGEVNRRLAAIAEARGIGFGLGSQRAMWKRPEELATYAVRDVAPSALLFGNIGLVQARDLPTSDVAGLAQRVGADALCVHMNPAMELVQPGGDRDFRGGIATYTRLVAELPVPVIAKETGCGIAPKTARRLHAAGVRAVDVSGAGGTSWVAVETHRAEGGQRRLGEALWDWGVPTAASVAFARRAGHEVVVATGGVATGLDVARSLALGATIAGIARPMLKALTEGGEAAVHRLIDDVEAELRAAMLLTGSRTLADLATADVLLGGGLSAWLRLGQDR